VCGVVCGQERQNDPTRYSNKSAMMLYEERVTRRVATNKSKLTKQVRNTFLERALNVP
jgi:hypothetical protein